MALYWFCTDSPESSPTHDGQYRICPTWCKQIVESSTKAENFCFWVEGPGCRSSRIWALCNRAIASISATKRNSSSANGQSCRMPVSTKIGSDNILLPDNLHVATAMSWACFLAPTDDIIQTSHLGAKALNKPQMFENLFQDYLSSQFAVSLSC